MANVFPASSSNPSAGSSHTPWVDEFFDFSGSGQRGTLGRFFSDTAAFFDPPSLASTESPSNEATAKGSRIQPMAMFSHDIHQEKANDLHSQGEERGCKAEPSSAQQEDLATESAVDPKKMKRVLANRQSAQRSRVRKLQYISELEQTVMSLQTEVAALSPRVAFFDQQRSLLTLGNNALKQQIAALAGDKIFMDAHQEALKNEIERLRQVYSHQNLKQASRTAPSPNHEIEKLLN